MTVFPFYKLISIDKYSTVPMYLQLANSIINAIEKGKLQDEDVIPSINELSLDHGISRDTAEKAYRYLKQKGWIGSVVGKGCFIKSRNTNHKLKLLLLFNQLCPGKKIIYDSFVSTLTHSASIDFYIYNDDILLFNKILHNRKDDYDYYIIIPHFSNIRNNAHQVINALPKEKLILLDRKLTEVTGRYSAVYENYEENIYQALEQALQPLRKYKGLNIVYSDQSYPLEIVQGFCKFCQHFGFPGKVIADVKKEPVAKGHVYITLQEEDLVTLVEQLAASKLEAGKDVGIISYNETPLKRIILNGITTISTDFQMMGEKAAQLIINKSIEQIETKFYVRLRNSL